MKGCFFLLLGNFPLMLLLFHDFVKPVDIAISTAHKIYPLNDDKWRVVAVSGIGEISGPPIITLHLHTPYFLFVLVDSNEGGW